MGIEMDDLVSFFGAHDKRYMSRFNQLTEATEDVKSSVEKIENAVYGNGKDGLSTRVRLLEQQGAAVRWTAVALVSFFSSVLGAVIIALLIGPK